MKNNEALGLLAEAIIAYYKQKHASRDAFESYAYGLRLKLGVSPTFFRSRFIRGYQVIYGGIPKKKLNKYKRKPKNKDV